MIYEEGTVLSFDMQWRLIDMIRWKYKAKKRGREFCLEVKCINAIRSVSNHQIIN